MILAVLLGPHAALLVMSSVLTVQALFFADGGLLALGCNVFNLGFLTCFVAYPLLWRPLAGRCPSRARLFTASVVAGVVGLQLGALSVVLETAASGVSTLPFGAFLALMQPIHLAIGLVEGLVTGAVILAIWQARPEAVEAAPGSPSARSLRSLVVSLAVAAVLLGGFGSWFASAQPDGLEWSSARAADGVPPAAPIGAVHALVARMQRATALLPDYGFAGADGAGPRLGAPSAWPAPSVGTTVSGLVGGLLVLLIAAAAGRVLRALGRRAARS